MTGQGDTQVAHRPVRTQLSPPPTRSGEARHEPRAAPGATSVCLYTPSFDPSGMGAHLLDLTAEYLPAARVSVLCWPTAPGRALLERAAALGATVLALPAPRDPSFARVIDAHLRETRPDVFHVHVGTGREDFDGARVASGAQVPAVVQTLHLPWLVRHHGKRRPFFHALRPVDAIVTVSQAQRRTYERIGVPTERLTTVPNGVRPRGPGPGRVAARERLGLEPDQPVVMTVGRLTVMKGQRYLVACLPDLVARWPRLVVLVAGEGHLRAQLRAQADALGLGSSLRLLGHRPDARFLLDAADVFVLPSRHEGMPLVLLEAMEAGLPVVATRVIGTDEVVVDGETGLLVPPEDPPALGRALAALLADPALRERQGAAGRRRQQVHFTSARMAAETLAVYARVLQQVAVGRTP